MSKIGKKAITIPSGVTVEVNDRLVKVKGPKGELSYTMLPGVQAKVEDTTVAVSIDDDSKRNLWGLTRTLVQNMVVGVSTGYQIKLHVL